MAFSKFFRSSMFLLICTMAFFTGRAQQGTDNETLVKEFVSYLQQKDFQRAVTYFDAKVSAALPPEKLQSVWTMLQAQMGSFQKTGTVKADAGGTRLKTECIFEKGMIYLLASFDNAHKMNGIYFAPGSASEAGKSSEYHRPDYIKPELFTEEKTEVVTGKYHLPAILTLPKNGNKLPLLILVHGSGPNDMNESIGPNQPFRDLAEGLSSMGIAVLRYDKRTRVYGAEMAAHTDSLTAMQEVIEDAISAIDKAKKTERIDPKKIYVLGHSLGGTLAPRIATLRPDLKGIIILAGAATGLPEHALEQMRYLYEVNGKPQSIQSEITALEAQIALLNSGNVPLSTPADQLPLGMSAAYWLDLMKYDQVALAKELKMKILVLQGERDYQITMQDYKVWQDALGHKKNASLRSYPKLNHLLQEGEGKSKPSEYEKEGHVPVYVVQNIAGWITKDKLPKAQ